MARTPAAADETGTTVLGSYAGLVHRALTDPQRWLGLDEDPPASAPAPLKVLDAVRERPAGTTTPASSDGGGLPVQKRVDGRLGRIAASAGLAAAAPRRAGALADRMPLQADLSASAAGLAVCATAREHGVTDAVAWAPLLAGVVFDRDLRSRHIPVRHGSTADQTRAAASSEASSTPMTTSSTHGRLGAGSRRAAGTVWQLARRFHEVSSMLDERPHGLLLWCAFAKLPVVGSAGGRLVERGAVRRASRRTTRLVRR